jgi:ABC-type multidrug transport system permease subunit
MRALFRLVTKEFAEVLLNPRALFITLLVPSLILVLVGRIQIRPPAVKVLVSGMGDCATEESIDETELTTYRYLQQLSWVDLACEDALELEPLQRLEQGDYDILVNVNDFMQGRWIVYHADTNPDRVRWGLRLAQGIQVSRREFTDAAGPTTVLFKMSTLGAMPLRSAFHYFPQSTRRSAAALPGTFGLILCFLPFVITAPSLIRERQGHTLEVLLSAPGANGDSVLVGKCLSCLAVSLVSAILMLFTIQATYQIYIKSDAVLFGLFLILPILSSALLGLIVSAVARTQTQTLLAATVYFLGLLLLSGFLYPLEGSATLVQTLSRFFSFTYLVDPAYTWIFGGDFKRVLSAPLAGLLIQCLAYAVIARQAWHWQLKRI